MTDIIYERGQARESIIWNPFQYNGPFNATQEVERAVVFGLYANTYLHGYSYLQEIETEDLARLVDNYTVAIAQITNEGAKYALEVAAKYYIEKIDNQIHDKNIITRERKIDALDDEYDARTAALEADEAAITTMVAKVRLAWDKATQKIKDLEMRTELEDVAQQLVDVDITEQELRAARADLAVIEAGLKGLDIQLSITQTGIDITNTDLQITNAESEVDEIGIRVSETAVKESGVDLDIVNAGVALSESEVKGAKIQRDTKEVGVRVAEVGIQIEETEARESQFDADIARIEADTAKLGLIDSEKTIAQADKRAYQAENALLVKEKGLLDSQGDNVKDETKFIDDQKIEQEILDGKVIEYDGADHHFNIETSQKETKFEDDLKTIKVAAFDTKRDLVDDTKDSKVDDAKDNIRIHDIRAQEAEALSAAAIVAARDMAEANIINTLTHSIGRA